MELEGKLEGSGFHPDDTTEDTHTDEAARAGGTGQRFDLGSPDQDSPIPDQLQSASYLSSTGANMPYRLADLAGCVRRQSDSHLEPMCQNAATASRSIRPNNSEGKIWPVQRGLISSSSVPIPLIYYLH